MRNSIKIHLISQNAKDLRCQRPLELLIVSMTFLGGLRELRKEASVGLLKNSGQLEQAILNWKTREDTGESDSVFQVMKVVFIKWYLVSTNAYSLVFKMLPQSYLCKSNRHGDNVDGHCDPMISEEPLWNTSTYHFDSGETSDSR